MQRPYTAVIGEAIWDLLDRPLESSFAQAPGGSCLNVAVGVARLDHRVEFIGAFGSDVLAERLRRFLTAERVALNASVTVPAQSTLAVTTFDGAEPHFAFYGHPAAHLQLQSSEAIETVARAASVVHFGSIGMLASGVRDAARGAYRSTAGLKTLDPNVRLDLIEDIARFRQEFEDLVRHVDLVKLSRDDAAAIYPDAPEDAPARILACGASAVLTTLDTDGAQLSTADFDVRTRSLASHVVDATGAGDAVTVGVIDWLLTRGWPTSQAQWQDLLRAAMEVAARTCSRSGGADAMPMRAELTRTASHGHPGGGLSFDNH